MNRRDFTILAEWVRTLGVVERQHIGESLMDTLDDHFNHFNRDVFCARAHITNPNSH